MALFFHGASPSLPSSPLNLESRHCMHSDFSGWFITLRHNFHSYLVLLPKYFISIVFFLFLEFQDMCAHFTDCNYFKLLEGREHALKFLLFPLEHECSCITETKWLLIHSREQKEERGKVTGNPVTADPQRQLLSSPHLPVCGLNACLLARGEIFPLPLTFDWLSFLFLLSFFTFFFF